MGGLAQGPAQNSPREMGGEWRQTLASLSNQGPEVPLRGGLTQIVTPDLSRILCGRALSTSCSGFLSRRSRGNQREKDKVNRQIKGQPGILPGAAPAV